MTAQWYGCPAKTPTPRTTEEKATWNCTAKSAPDEMPEMVTAEVLMLRVGSAMCRSFAVEVPAAQDGQRRAVVKNEKSCATAQVRL